LHSFSILCLTNFVLLVFFFLTALKTTQFGGKDTTFFLIATFFDEIVVSRIRIMNEKSRQTTGFFN